MVSSRGVSTAFLIAALGLSACVSLAQIPQEDRQVVASQLSKPNPPKRVTSQQSVVVEAKLTPEEIEEGRINDVYQAVYKIQQQRDFEGAILKYQSDVIPLAEQAKFEVPKNKFLFLAYRGVGDCDLASGKFTEAEDAFHRL